MMTFRTVSVSLGAALMLAACGDNTSEEAEAPAEVEAAATEEAAPVAETEVVADAPPTEITPEQPNVVVEQASEAVQGVVEDVAQAATEQINQIAEGQPLDEAAQELAQDAATAVAEQVEELSESAGGVTDGLAAVVGQVANQVAEEVASAATSEVDWQSTFAAEVPFLNTSEAAVSAFAEPGVGDAIATVEPGSGGYIETCNATLDWCRLDLGGDTGSLWVDMANFGGVAN